MRGGSESLRFSAATAQTTHILRIGSGIICMAWLLDTYSPANSFG